MIAEAPVRFRLYGTQDDFVADQRRYLCFIGGRNSGKTYAGSVKAFLRATEGGLGVIAAPTFPMLEHGAKRQFLARLDEAGIDYRLNGQKGVAYIYRWNAEVLFATLETEGRVRGPNFSWGWPDELDYLADRGVWKALKGAVRDGPNPQLFGTTTPKGRGGIVYDEWVVNATDQHTLYRATTYDNVFIDAADYVTGLGYAGAFYEQEIAAEFVAFEGLVYPAFNRSRHVRMVDTDGWATAIGVDLGTRNPTALLVCKYAGERRHYAAEHYERGMSSDAITDLVVRAWKTHRPDFVVVDPSAAGLILSLQQRGVRVRKAVNDVSVGIANLTSLIAGRMPDGETRLSVDPSCVNFIAEVESYRYPDTGRGNADNPVKENDHLMDCARYLEMELDRPRKRIGTL